MPGFVIKVVWRNGSLQFLPSYERLRGFIVLICEIIEEMPLNLKRIEHHFYNNFSTTKFLKV